MVGLGNPGPLYADTRHNVGFKVIDALSRKTGTRLQKIWFKPVLTGRNLYQGTLFYLIKPLTFMNRSGAIFPYVFKKTSCSKDDLIVICDNLDLPPGRCRMKKKGTAGGQRGLESIIQAIGVPDFKRIFVGIGRPTADQTVHDWVLGCPEPESGARLSCAVERAARALIDLSQKNEEEVIAGLNRHKNA